MREITPIDYSIKPEKAKQWHYKIHPYFTKQASNVVREYIKKFSDKGEIVLDPFAGTGVTAIESLTLGRRTIALDLSPLSCFITRETCIAPVKLSEFEKEFQKLKSKLKDIVEFVREANDLDIENYEIQEWYPKGVRLPSNSDFEFVEDLFHQRQLIVYAELYNEIKRIKDEEIRNLLKLVFSNTLGKANLTYMDNKARGEEGGGSSVFGKYRYWKPKGEKIVDVWKNFENRFRYTLKAKQSSNKLFGDFYKELNFSKRISLSKLNAQNWTFAIICNSACYLTKHLPESSIDYIYTDPPYGAHIAYLDLSTMWHAWLELEVTEKMRKEEAIEGGELKKSKDEYKELIFNSIEQMAKVLKPDHYLSLVFQHKEVEFWNMILEACEKSGFRYVNTVYQPTKTTSIHKKTNPLVVMGSQLIMNFKRSSRKIVSVIGLKDESQIEQIILDTAERVILEKGGYCITEDIYASVVPKLMESGLLDLANKRYKNLMPLLDKHFVLDGQGNWQIKKGTTIGSYIDKKLKIEYYLRSVFKRREKVKLDDLIGAVFPNLTNGVTPTKEEFMEVLKRIAGSKDGIYWQLKDKEMKVQLDLDFKMEYTIPNTTEHNQVIFRLAMLGGKLGLKPFIGKQEQRDKAFDRIDFIKDVPTINVTAKKEDISRIEQVDCIWFYKDGTPAFAFEVEEHTGILSALERFYSLLKIAPEIGHNKRLVIIAPQSRKRKLEKELKTSSFIGAPMYIEQKLKYMYKEDFIKAYKELVKRMFELKDIDRILIDINPD